LVDLRPAAPFNSVVVFTARGLQAPNRSIAAGSKPRFDSFVGFSAQGFDGDFTLLSLGLNDPAGARDGSGERRRMPMTCCRQAR
jgi:hypothetical protein